MKVSAQQVKALDFAINVVKEVAIHSSSSSFRVYCKECSDHLTSLKYDLKWHREQCRLFGDLDY